MKYLFKIFLVLLAATSLSGCAKNPAGELYNMEKVLVKGGDFWITTYQKITDKNAPYVFYIEGDGAAYMGKYRISTNPTPRRQMFINLASMDTRPNVIYVARPCQYTPIDMNPKCLSNQYWSNKRMSEDSIFSLNEVVNSINNRQKFSLVGISGGGGVAVLIAARNPTMVRDIITLAGNIDHIAFTEHHNVTPMIGSLNPIDYTDKIRNIPQLHVSGGKDRIIPPFIADKFVQKAHSPCVKQRIFEKITHDNGWKEIWEYLYTAPLTCSN